jgi:hypothetical protein
MYAARLPLHRGRRARTQQICARRPHLAGAGAARPLLSWTHLDSTVRAAGCVPVHAAVGCAGQARGCRVRRAGTRRAWRRAAPPLCGGAGSSKALEGCQRAVGGQRRLRHQSCLALLSPCKPPRLCSACAQHLKLFPPPGNHGRYEADDMLAALAQWVRTRHALHPLRARCPALLRALPGQQGRRHGSF